MTLDQVRYFLVLCRELSFTRAAKLCGISQPSMTNAISALESEFGAQLFHRSPQVRLSEFGAQIKPAFEKIEAAVGEIQLLIERMRPSRRVRANNGMRRYRYGVRAAI
jgi:DNA-binding transcriptional LysR family regulator